MQVTLIRTPLSCLCPFDGKRRINTKSQSFRTADSEGPLIRGTVPQVDLWAGRAVWNFKLLEG